MPEGNGPAADKIIEERIDTPVAPAPKRTPAIYEGFSRKARYRIVMFSAFIAIINIALAWYFVADMNKNIRFGEQEVKTIKALTADLGTYDTSVVFRAHVLNTQVHIKGITNKQSIILLSVGSGFALMAIGFALFLLGADGAFKIQAEKSPDSKLMLSGTAPGLLCFLLGAALIFTAVTKTHKLDIGKFSLESVSPSHSEEKMEKERDFPSDEEIDGL